MNEFKMEVCIDSVQSALNAEKGGKSFLYYYYIIIITEPIYCIFGMWKRHFIAQVAQAPKGAVIMTLRNSVIFIRVCVGIEPS